MMSETNCPAVHLQHIYQVPGRQIAHMAPALTPDLVCVHCSAPRGSTPTDSGFSPSRVLLMLERGTGRSRMGDTQAFRGLSTRITTGLYITTTSRHRGAPPRSPTPGPRRPGPTPPASGSGGPELWSLRHRSTGRRARRRRHRRRGAETPPTGPRSKARRVKRAQRSKARRLLRAPCPGPGWGQEGAGRTARAGGQAEKGGADGTHSGRMASCPGRRDANLPGGRGGRSGPRERGAQQRWSACVYGRWVPSPQARRMGSRRGGRRVGRNKGSRWREHRVNAQGRPVCSDGQSRCGGLRACHQLQHTGRPPKVNGQGPVGCKGLLVRMQNSLPWADREHRSFVALSCAMGEVAPIDTLGSLV
mmetsp:Transcript_88777/g.236288  ORF Transcript_88777/g.236288 Transcript_88777/m.236288 type:complete len:361 (-) Transcript_88777:598-1680(-)